MALLQRISRNILTCGILPSSWLRKIGKRKLIKLVVLSLIFYLLFVFITKNSHQNNLLTNHLDGIHFKADSRSIDLNSNIIKVKEEPPVRHLMGKRPRCLSQPETLIGQLAIHTNVTPTFEEVKNQSDSAILNGGCYKPVNCNPIQKVAIIIPFKDRDAHLKALLFYLHPMLQRQQIAYCIYVAEQFDNGRFNKAMVMNAAFEEAMKRDIYDCIVFHDVDMIPENDRNMYMCGNQPKHLSPAIDKFNYAPRYGTDYGGVTAISPTQYRIANGHSNQFWGWGGEDNDMEFRIFHRGMRIVPSPLKIGRYKMIQHKHPWQFSPNKFPWILNKTREARASTDGLSDLQYRMVSIDLQSTYTKLMIDIRKIEVKRITLYIDGNPSMDIDIKPGLCRWEEYDGKYLDFSIELSDIPEAAHLRIPETKIKYAPIPNSVNIKVPPVADDDKLSRFSMVEHFSDALNLCEMLQPECQGILRENKDGYYSLRKSGLPRHIVVTGANHGNAKKGRFYFPNKSAFVKYCPGHSSNFQWFNKPLLLNPDLEQNITQHRYSYQVHFSVKCRWIEYNDITIERFLLTENSTYLANLSKSKEICEEMGPMCAGVIQENNTYSLQAYGSPRHKDNILQKLIKANNGKTLGGSLGNDLRLGGLRLINKDNTGHVKVNANTEQTLSEINKDSITYVKYCPALFGSYQRVPKKIQIFVYKNITEWLNDQAAHVLDHFFSFSIQFKVLLQPPEYLYYRDSKFFEAQQSKGETYYTFNWANKDALDFSNPETPREFTVKSAEFSMSNIPGCYAIESKLQDRLNQPFFQWNWWFEVTTGDKQKDAEIREETWKKQMKDKAISNENVKVNQRVAMQARREAEFQRQMAKIHKNDLQHQKKTAGNAVIEKLYNSENQDYDNEDDNKDEHFGKKWKRLTPQQQQDVEKEILADDKNAGQIKVFDFKDTLAPIKQVKPTISLKPARMKAFHIGKHNSE